MKKAMILVLAVALIMAMAVPAFAVDSPTAPAATPNKTASLPVIIDQDTEDTDCLFYSIFEADELSEEDAERFIASQDGLKEATPEGMMLKYFFYHIHGEGSAHHGLCQHTFDIGEFEKVIVMQYVDEEWIDLVELGKKEDVQREVIENPDGTVTVIGLETGPIAIFTK